MLSGQFNQRGQGMDSFTNYRCWLVILFLLRTWFPAQAQENGDLTGENHPILQAMQEELQRSMAVLGQDQVPPYFLSYEITDMHTAQVGASFGVLTNSYVDRRRQLDIDLRVGTYQQYSLFCQDSGAIWKQWPHSRYDRSRRSGGHPLRGYHGKTAERRDPETAGLTTSVFRPERIGTVIEESVAL